MIVKTKTKISTMFINVGYFKIGYIVSRPNIYNIKTKKQLKN